MSRRRSDSEQEDSLDLMLDTVSNVFGGVMFLTLLAALLIMSKGSEQLAETEVEAPVVDVVTNARLISSEIRQAAAAIEAQKKMIDRLDPEGNVSEQTDRLNSLRQTIGLARRQVRRAGTSVESREQELKEEQEAQADLEEQIKELEVEVAAKSQEVNQIRAESQRTVKFRPLSRSGTAETVVILRYGRWYLLYEGAFGGRLNRNDFFVLGKQNDVTSVTPKPHRGQRVTDESLVKLVEKLKLGYPVRKFHVTIAVWDDSFEEFNPLKDALSKAGYRYRTLTCDGSSRLSNQAAVDPFVQ